MSDNTALSAPTEEKQNRVRPWPVTTLGLFLLLQTAGLLALAAFELLAQEILSGDLTANLSSLLGVLYLLLAVLAFISALGFFRLWLNSWLTAMLLQGLCLIIALILYFQGRPDYTFGLMAYAVFMVVYLNHYEVRDAFHAHKLLMVDPEEWLP
jgi:hypothetical protein